jgi:SAM-dependent methyltransferase
LLATATEARRASPGVRYPDWYLRKMHHLPDGYLSHRSARLYEATIARLYQSGVPSYVAKLAADAIAAFKPRSILELGIGPGFLLQALEERGADIELTGVDLSPFMLDAAARRAASASLVHADSAALEMEKSYDAVAAVHMVGHMPKLWAARTLQTAARHLNPEGRLHVLGHSWHRLPHMSGPIRIASSHRLLGGLLTHHVLVPTIE